MKTTAKLSLLAAAFLLVLASCTNNFTPTAPAENAFAKNVENKNNQVSTQLRVVSISGITRYGDESGYRATVTFSKPVDVESVKKAVHVRQLKPLTEEGNPQLGDELTLEWLTTTVNSEPTAEVSFKIVTTSTMAVYVSVKGDTVKAAGTDQKMDQDRDNEQGESTDSYKGDDDYNEILPLEVTYALSPASASGTNIYVGNRYYLYTTASGTRKVNTILSGKVSFERGKKADDVNTVVAENGDLVTHVVISNAYQWDPNKFDSEESYGITKEDFEAFVNKHVVVEQFTDKEWKPVTANFVTDTTTTSSSYRKLVAAVSPVTENTEIRVRFKDIRVIAVKSSRYEYALRYTTDAHATDNADTTPLISGNSGVKAGVIAFNTAAAFTFTWEAGNKVALTLKPSAFTYYDEGERTITPVLEKDKTYSLSYTGFVPGTLSKDHFKFDGNATFTAENTYAETSGISKTFLNYPKSFSVSVPLKLVKASSPVSKHVQLEGFSFEPSDISVYPNAANDKLTLTYTPFTADENKQLKLDGDAFEKALNELYNSVQYSTTYYKYITYQSDPLTQAFCAEVASAVESAVNEKNRQIMLENPSSTPSDLISDSEKQDAIRDYVVDIIAQSRNNFFSNYKVTAAPAKATTFPNLYVSPAVKTAAFKGQYDTGKVDADGNAIIKQVDVGEFSFETKRSSFDNQLEKDGWAKISLH